MSLCSELINTEENNNKTHQFDIRQRQVGINDAKVQNFPKTCFKTNSGDDWAPLFDKQKPKNILNPTGFEYQEFSTTLKKYFD